MRRRMDPFPRILLGLIVILVLLFFFLLLKRKPIEEIPQTMSHLVLVLDPGHGGFDGGAYCHVNGRIALESSTAYDVAERVRLHAEERGALVVPTLFGGRGIDNTKQLALSDTLVEKFSLDSTIVESDSVGLMKRVEIGKRTKRLYQHKTVMWLSLHYDDLNPERSGIRIIYSPGSEHLANVLEAVFRSVGFVMVVDRPVLLNASYDRGIRNLIVMRDVNPIRDKAYIELGNTQNPTDCESMADPEYREMLALLIIEALENRLKMEV